MTVQSIDKRVVPEANMTSAAQDKQQGAVSVEDAFVALLHQTTQRFANKAALGGSTAGQTVLADHVTRMKVEVKADKPQVMRDDAAADRNPSAKDTRTVTTKGDKSRQANSSATTARANDAAPAPQAAADNDAPVTAASDDGGSNSASSQDDKDQPAKPEAQAEPQQTVTATPEALPERIEVEVDITIEETITVVQTAAADQAGPVDLNQLAQNAAEQIGQGQTGAVAQNTQGQQIASGKDGKKITDLENRIVDDMEQGDMDDAMDAAMELAATLVKKAGQHGIAASDAQQQTAQQTDQVQNQIQDMAAMLAGTNTHVEVKVQVTETASDTLSQGSASVLGVLAQMDLAVQDGAHQNQGFGQNTPNQGGQNQDAAISLQPVADASAQLTQSTETEAKPFTAILAAQLEASNQADAAAPEMRPVAGLGAVSGPQATDKASASVASQAPRTPRTLVAQQVMEQVTVQIDKAVKDGNDMVKIQLKPYELGKIEVKLEVASDGRVTATVSADKPETLAMLQKDAKGLEKALEDAGLKPEAGSTSFSLRGGEHQQNADRGNNQGRSGRSRGRAHTAGDESLRAAGSVQGSAQRSLGGRSGVDISV
ncbi:Flagellar hook-length control protein [Candidatus Terasakiella magnetica]|nr:Flagellar hook-length control protein [Candidatus Terasakiella magnetica]